MCITFELYVFNLASHMTVSQYLNHDEILCYYYKICSVLLASLRHLFRLPNNTKVTPLPFGPTSLHNEHLASSSGLKSQNYYPCTQKVEFVFAK